MDISIIIRTLNEARFLPELLQAIKSQELAGWESEVVVVDSGSSDATLDIANSFGCRIVTIAKSEFTFGRSLNMGCDAGAGRFLVFVSGHCIPVGSDWLVNLCGPLDTGICTYTYGRQIERKGHNKFSEKQLFLKYFPPHSSLPQDGFFCNNANAAILQSTWLQRRFDEEVTGLEDMELAKQLWQAGDKIGYVAEAVVEHIHEEDWGQVKRRYEREAVALQSIMPEVHIRLSDCMRYIMTGIYFDCTEALRERSFWRNLRPIFLFRVMQYWGTYRGNNDHRKLSREAKERYFYPR